MDTAVSDEVFSGTVRTAALGRLQTVTMDGVCPSALRTRRFLAQGGEDEYAVVTLLERGATRLEQDGREALLEPGAVFVHDTARPVRLHPPRSFRTQSLVLPRDVLGPSESDMARITASPLGPDTPLGGLLSPFPAGLVDGAGSYPPRTGELMARNVVDLLGVPAHEALGRPRAGTSGGNQTLLLRIQAFIGRHLADPDPTPQAIARAHHISLRYLHKLFEGEDVTVGRWIQRRRLAECRRDLACRAKSATIAAVAHRWGFTSVAHFSRVFRAAYGMTLPANGATAKALGSRRLRTGVIRGPAPGPRRRGRPTALSFGRGEAAAAPARPVSRRARVVRRCGDRRRPARASSS
ncbi:helix-turn-helix domain-containing protein [Streptomyces sp. NPDC093586]|uniref:helix-turn-helix domain-containing protein n=1 Tax=Streptomyces sp. NPDC093586 TaxID=3366042 RepID=UPI0038153E02